METKKELFGIELKQYLNASKKEKGEILDSLERQTGMWRESIMRSFRRKQMEATCKEKTKRGRKVYYGKDVDEALKATVKRRVTGWKYTGSRRGISTTSPSLIKDKIPLFEGSWYEVKPGIGQIDTVAHCGGSMAGDFMFSLGYVDVSSGWFEYTMPYLVCSASRLLI